MNALTGVVQEEVPVVKDFLDVFPEELQACHQIDTLSF